MTIVETALGRVEGTTERGALAFKGIPYAAAPVGRRRFRPPEPAEPWSGVRPATSDGSIAPQAFGTLERVMGIAGLTQDEDCLTLNVFTPGADDARRPVLVWIHGGAFFSGSASVPWYHGGRLARTHDVVVVAMNYRLGPLGFLHLEHLLGEEFRGSGNAGLLDQVAALEWVRDNVAAFGGDPANVTVFGESAGAMSIGCLLAMPAARGLFHQAVLMSGAAQGVHEPEWSEVSTAETLAEVGLTEATAHRVVDVPVEALVRAEEALVGKMFDRGRDAAAKGGLSMPFQPVIDGHTVPRHPLEAVRAGRAASIPLVVGTTKDEMRLFNLFDQRMRTGDEAEMIDLCESVFAATGSPGAGREAFEAYRSRRPGAAPADVFNVLVSDYVFRMPAIRLAEAAVGHQPDTWMYRFSWASPNMGDAGAFHGIDIVFWFDNVRMPGVGMLLGDMAVDGERLAGGASGALAAFARDGVPSDPALPEWPRYDTQRRATLDLDVTCTVLDDPDADDRMLWEGVR